MLLENMSNLKNDINDVIVKIKEFFSENNNSFNLKVNGLEFWCDNDKEKTIFVINNKGGFATFCKNDLDNEMEYDIIESIIFQLNNTEEDN